MNEKIPKPKQFTDAEAEAFTIYLTKIPKAKKRSLVEALLETGFGRSLVEEWKKYLIESRQPTQRKRFK